MTETGTTRTSETPPPPSEETGGGRRRGFGPRLLDALRLDARLYEEVEHDPGALGQAAGVVALAAVASAVGFAGSLGLGALLSGLALSFLAWVVWTAIVWAIGVQILKHTSDFQELLRTLGFVAAPQVGLVLGVIPSAWVQAIVGVVVLAMTGVAFVRAVRQALDVDNQRAVLVALVSIAAYVILALLLGA